MNINKVFRVKFFYPKKADMKIPKESNFSDLKW